MLHATVALGLISCSPHMAHATHVEFSPKHYRMTTNDYQKPHSKMALQETPMTLSRCGGKTLPSTFLDFEKTRINLWCKTWLGNRCVALFKRSFFGQYFKNSPEIKISRVVFAQISSMADKCLLPLELQPRSDLCTTSMSTCTGIPFKGVSYYPPCWFIYFLKSVLILPSKEHY